jgi:hypothetical protein
MKKASVFAIGLLLVVSGAAHAQVRVPGFLPSQSGFAFRNSFPKLPHLTIDFFGASIPIGDASTGLCGGMVFAARDYHEAGLPPPVGDEPPTDGPLYEHLVNRLYDSFDIPAGPSKYRHLMDPTLPDHETWASRARILPRGRAWVTIREEWPKIKADLDAGVLSPMALIHVKTLDFTQMGRNHQVLAWGYDLSETGDLVLHVYDPNRPGDDGVTVSLNIADPERSTEMWLSGERRVWAFFRPDYTFVAPPELAARVSAR